MNPKPKVFTEVPGRGATRRFRPGSRPVAPVVALLVWTLLGGCGTDLAEPGTLTPAAAPTQALAQPEPSAPAEAEPAQPDPQPSAPADPQPEPEPESESPADGSGIRYLVPEVIAVYPHDNTAYTQGFELAADGTLIEGTGRTSHPGGNEIYGSDLRRLDVETGAVLDSVALPDKVFGEGTTIVDNMIVQISWKDGIVFFWDAESFEPIGRSDYDGQGWGLCYDGERLVMTDGSATLFFRDPDSFELIGSIPVSLDDQPLGAINELECLDGHVWANVWQTDMIVRIDPIDGRIDTVVDASSLEQPRVRPTEVLNGIAWDSTDGTWLVTGKFWPRTYRVNFVPADR